MDITDKLNMTMLCDFYELTMGNGYLEAGLKDRITYFDIFFRDVPDHGGYAICAGLERIIAYIQDLHFSEEDIEYLRSKDLFSERFLDYLRDFKFTGDVWAIPEGTPIFPREPIITVRAPSIQAQLVETFLLLIFNHQSLVATKTNRIVRAAEGRVILEFGSRRAQGTDAAISGARAAYIGGCAGTACTISDQLFGVPAGGTMAHAWVQMFDSEYEAFKTYCEVFPTNATLLVDTYNTLKSGVPNAIKAFNEVLRPKGITKCAIRLDSGDIAYLTREARRMLDEAGWELDAAGTRQKGGVKAELTVMYPMGDSTRQALAADLANQLGELGIAAKAEGVDWDTAYARALAEPLVWGWGAHTPMELYNIYHTAPGADTAEYSPYASARVDELMDAALAGGDLEESYALWQQAQSEVLAQEVPWVWLVNIDHLYWVRGGLAVAQQKLHPHGHGWSIVNNVDQWSWTA